MTIVESVIQPFSYSGREYDSESGLYFYRARYLDPNTGRFLGKDPIGFSGQDQNLYRYVLNNPVNFTDPFGLFVFGVAESGTLAAGPGGDVAAGIVADFNGNVAGIVSGGISAGPQFAATASPSVIIAPFAENVSDLQGTTLDIQIRFVAQLTISIPVQVGPKDANGITPVNFTPKNTVFSLDAPGVTIGVGVGKSGTAILGKKNILEALGRGNGCP